LACFNSGHRIEDHFADVSKMIEIGKADRREINVTLLSRYARYLIIQYAEALYLLNSIATFSSAPSASGLSWPFTISGNFIE
jgi:hypothetical protein